MMRVTVDIDADVLARVQKATGTPRRSLAVKKAVRGYLHAVDRRRFLQKVYAGGTDYTAANADLERYGTHNSLSA